MLTDKPVLATADLHLSPNPRDAYRFGVVDHLLEIIKKHKCESVLILGDLTEEKDRHPASLVARVVESLARLAKICRVIVLRGNHDYTNPSTPFFGFVNVIPNISWINSMGMHEGCAFLPHTSNYERDWKSAPDLSKVGNGWIFAHNAFEGAVGDNGRRLPGIPTARFKGFRVIAGDIHTPQTIGPVTYVGAPYTVDFGDTYDPRVLILHKDKAKSVPVRGPRKIVVNIAATKLLMNNFFGNDAGFEPGSMVKVVVDISREARNIWPDLQAKAREWITAQGCTAAMIQPRVAQAQMTETAPVEVSLSDEEWLADYSAAAGVKPRIVKTGLYLLGKA